MANRTNKTPRKLRRWLAFAILCVIAAFAVVVAVRLITKPPAPPPRNYVAEYNAMLDKLGPYDTDAWAQFHNDLATLKTVSEQTGKEVFGPLTTAKVVDVLMLLFPEEYEGAVMPDPAAEQMERDSLKATRLAYERLDALNIGSSLDGFLRTAPVTAPLQSSALRDDLANVSDLCYLTMARCDFAMEQGDVTATTTELQRIILAAASAVQHTAGGSSISVIAMLRLSFLLTTRVLDRGASIDAARILAAMPTDLHMQDAMLRNAKAGRLLLLDTIDRYFNGDPTGTITRLTSFERLWKSEGEFTRCIDGKFDCIDQWLQLPPIERRKTSLEQVVAPIKAPNQAVDLMITTTVVGAEFNIMGLFDQRYQGIRLMLALEVYRERNGAYPDALSALAPDILSTLPSDSYAPDGQFRYARNGDSYRLWSVAFDGVDDNGAPIESKRGNDAFSGKGDWLLFPPPE